MDTPGTDHPVTLITGAGSGIGHALALMLAERGHHLALVGRSADKLHGTATSCAAGRPGCHTLVLAGDVADSDFAHACVDRTITELGRLDVVVNCAGVAPKVPIADTGEDVLEEAFLVNAFGPAFMITRAWPHFCARNTGCIVNVSSLATTDPFPGFFAYAASKSALESLTRSAHGEGKRHGIRAFSVAPGAVETPLLRQNFSEKVLPHAATLDPEAVASLIVDCIEGRRDEDRGKSIAIKK
ncbi:MAG: SDR family NAD(P)-dependent oxidoreductase [Phycisphaerales bacterium]|jgi:NAD(P)-dependent dehydrogenase (short-subunit alcohol dehydrogenase family)